jgi:addiction module RelE/StbE family toxin
MVVSYSKNFLKQYAKLQPKTRLKTDRRILLWQSNPLHQDLRNHALKGKYKGYRSIDITGDIRALYLSNNEEVIFDGLGTHAQLYG